MKIAIIGAGIGGLTAALFLEKAGLSVDIYEQTNQIKPIGAGIILAHNAMQVYNKLGLKNTISNLGCPLSSLNIVTPQFHSIKSISTIYFDKKYSVQSVAIHRGVLQELLVSKVRKTSLQLNKNLISIKENDQVSLLFLDGSEKFYDLVIGADGIRSTIRNKLFSESSIRRAHQTCWRGIANSNCPVKFSYQLIEAWGLGSRFGFVQISLNQVYWYALRSDTPNNHKENLIEIFRDYAPIVREIILKTNTANIIKRDIEDLKPINSWVKGNVCLLGDAAHATTPNMGQGACQAIVDAYVLSQCLSHSGIDTALKKYEQLRKVKAQKIVNMSWMIGKISHIQSPFISRIRNLMVSSIPASVNQRQLERVFTLVKL